MRVALPLLCRVMGAAFCRKGACHAPKTGHSCRDPTVFPARRSRSRDSLVARRRATSVRSRSSSSTDTRPARSRSPSDSSRHWTAERSATSPNARLYLDVPGYRVGGRFESIRVRDGRFEGRTSDGKQIQASLDQVAGARVVRPSPARTVVLVGGVSRWSVVERRPHAGQPDRAPGRRGEPPRPRKDPWRRRW